MMFLRIFLLLPALLLGLSLYTGSPAATAAAGAITTAAAATIPIIMKTCIKTAVVIITNTITTFTP